MNGIHKLTVALLTVVAASTWNTTFATSLTMDVESTDSATVSAPISTGTLNKTNAGSLALSSTSNAIGNLDIQGGLVSVSAASNLNGPSSAVTFAASGTATFKFEVQRLLNFYKKLLEVSSSQEIFWGSYYNLKYSHQNLPL